jgi:hypothetical protein
VTVQTGFPLQSEGLHVHIGESQMGTGVPVTASVGENSFGCALAEFRRLMGLDFAS